MRHRPVFPPSSDLADCGGVDILEIEQHDLRVGRLERADHVRQPRQRLLLGDPALWVGAVGNKL